MQKILPERHRKCGQALLHSISKCFIKVKTLVLYKNQFENCCCASFFVSSTSNLVTYATLSTVGDTPPSSLKRCGLEQTMTPSVSQSSGRFRGRSVRPIPSFPCSSSMSRSCLLLLLRMSGPIFLRMWPSRNIG